MTNSIVFMLSLGLTYSIPATLPCKIPSNPDSGLTCGVGPSGILLSSALPDTVVRPISALPGQQLTTLGGQSSVFVLVNFRDAPNNKPWSLATVNNLFDGASNYLYEVSYQQTYLTGGVIDWKTLPIDSTANCDSVIESMASIANNATQIPGVDLSRSSRVVFLFPKATACNFAGLGQVGGARTISWINGNISPRVVTHEIGHNLGLWHARLYKCQKGTNPIATGCESIEYGDPSDTMGNHYQGHFNAYHKESLGWLNNGNSPTIELISQAGNFLLESYESQTKNRKALKILKANLADGSQDYYYIEFRQPIGFDKGLKDLPKSNLHKGILLHSGNDLAANSNFLLDMSPQTESAFDAALTPGQSFYDADAPGGGIIVTVNSVSADGANVSVNYGTNERGVRGSANRPENQIYFTSLIVVISILLNN